MWWSSAVNRSFFLCLAACRRRSSAWDTLSRFRARRVLCWSAFPLAPPPPRPLFWLRSAASLLLWRGLTSPVRASSATAPRLPDADPGSTPGRAGDLPVPGQEASVHAGVFDHAGSAKARAGASARVAFRHSNTVGTRDCRPFAARWPACTLPCRRFAGPLAGADARLGASVGRYTFTVEDFHLLLLAGLPAHYRRRIVGSGELRERFAVSFSGGWRCRSARSTLFRPFRTRQPALLARPFQRAIRIFCYASSWG